MKREPPLYPGDLVEWKDSVEFSMVDEGLNLGQVGVVLRMGESWEKYVPGVEPLNVLFGTEIHHIYMDEIRVLCKTSGSCDTV